MTMTKLQMPIAKRQTNSESPLTGENQIFKDLAVGVCLASGNWRLAFPPEEAA